MLITEESKEKHPPQVKQQETMVSSVELVPPVAPSLPTVEPKTVPDVVDEGFYMVSHPQTPVAVIPVNYLFTQDKPICVEATAETVSIRESQEHLPGEETDVSVASPIVSQHEPLSEDTLASDGSLIHDEEAPVENYAAVEFVLKQEAGGVEVGSQTGNSLLLDQPKMETLESSVPAVARRDVGIICHPPVDTEVQTEFSSQSVSEVVPSAAKEEVPAEAAVQTVGHMWTSPIIEMQKNMIHVFKKITGDEESIEIATKTGIEGGGNLVAPTEPEEKHVDTGDELLVEVKYKGKGQEDNQAETRMSELNIVHTAPQSFETVLIDPDESTTEVIVDKDGNQKIIVRKVRHTVISQQQQQQHTVQQRFQTFTTSDIGSECSEVPETQSVAFSQVTLQGQESTVSESQGDGKLHVTTTKSYTGKVAAGIPGGDLTFSEFSTEPQHQTVTYHTVSGEECLPASAFLRGIGVQEISGDNYVVVEPEDVVKSQPEEQGAAGDQLITTSTSSVRTVVQQVTRRVRRIRRVVRKVVVIDGKEHVTEEVVEEPEEVEVTEDIPRVTVEISRTGDVDIGQQISYHDLQTGYQLFSSGDKPVQVDPGFVPGMSHILPLQEGLDTSGNVTVEGKPINETQDVLVVEKYEPSQLQDEHSEVIMDVQTPLEKQEHMQGQLTLTAPGSLHEEKQVTAEKTEVGRLFVDKPEEVVVLGTHDAKTVLAINRELEDEGDRKLQDGSESPLLHDTQVVVEDKIMPETSVERTHLQEFNDNLAASEFNKENAVIAGEKLPVEEEIFGDVTSSTYKQDELQIVTGTEEIISNTPSVFDTVGMKIVEVKPKTELQSGLSRLKPVADSDIQHAEEQGSGRQLEEPESPCLVHYEATVTGVETVTQIPTEESSDMSPAMESYVLPEPKETRPTEESEPKKAVIELQDQYIPVNLPVPQKYFDLQTQDTTTGDNVDEETAKGSELSEHNGTVHKVTSEVDVESQSTDKPHSTVEDTVTTVSQPELSRVIDVRTSEVPEDEDFTPGVVVKPVTQLPRPNEFQQTVKKPDGSICQDVTSQTSPEQGVKTIEFILSVEEKGKPFLQETSDMAPKVSAVVKIEEKGLGESSEDKRDELSSVTLSQYEIVKEDFAIQLPGAKTMSHTVTEEVVTSARSLLTSLKTESEPKEETSSKSEAESSTSKKSRKRKKHKGKGRGESSHEVDDNEQVKASEEISEVISHVITLDTHEGQVSVETSLAESTDIIIPGSPASTSSDTTKPTEQEIEMFETPISPHSPRDSERTHDTGYDPEDKTTLDETSIIEENDKQRNKRKKKKKQKIVKESKDSSSIIPKSSIDLVANQTADSSDLSSIEKHDVEPSKEMEREVHVPESYEVSTAVSDSTAEKLTSDGVPIDRKGRKRKKAKSETENAFEFRESDVALSLQIADARSPEYTDETHKELVDSVKIMEEGVPTRPPSEAVDVLGDSHPKAVQVLELEHVQEQFTQTVTPDVSKSPDTVMIESSIQTIKEEVPVTQEESVQTVTPEIPVLEKTETTDISVQTWKEDLVFTHEESAQTKTPELVEGEAVLMTETSIQTSEMEQFPTHKEAVQTLTSEPIWLVPGGTVDSSIQNKTEETTPIQEGVMQTLTPEVPVADTKDTSIQTLKEELTPVHEESVQTVTPEPAEIPETLKLEISKEEINPVCEESAQTATPERPSATFEMLRQKMKVDLPQTQEGITQTVFSPEVSEIARVPVFETSVQTTKEDIIPVVDKYSQTVLPGVPQIEKTELTEILAQTTKALVPSRQEEYAQTSSPEETFIQAPKEEIPTVEQYSETITVVDSSIQTKDNTVAPISEEFSQTLPLGLSDPEDDSVLEPKRTDIIGTGHPGEDDKPVRDLPETTLSHVLFIPVDKKVETAETSIQTKPVFVKEYGDERSQSSSSEEPYEIHVQTSVSFIPSLESGDIWRSNCDINTGGASEDRKPRTPGDGFVSSVCDIKQDRNVCTTTEIPLIPDDVKSEQVATNVFNIPGMKVEPITDLSIESEENIEPSTSSDLPRIEPKEDGKKVMHDFLSSEIGTALKERGSTQQAIKCVQDKIVPDFDLETKIEGQTTFKYTEPEERKPSKDRKSKHKKKPKKVQIYESSNVLEPVALGYQEQTLSSDSFSEPTDLGEAHLIIEGSHKVDEPELKPENIKTKIEFEKGPVWTEDKVVIPSEPEITSEDKPQHSELCVSNKSKKSSKVLKSPADTKSVTDAELAVETQALGHVSDDEITPQVRESFSAVSELPQKPADHVETAFLIEERKVSGQPVGGEHSPGPSIEHESAMAKMYTPDQDMEPATLEIDVATVTEQFLIDSHKYPGDTAVESDLTYIKEESVTDSDITEKNVTPITTLKESDLILQEPSMETLEPHISYSEHEVELSQCKIPVNVGDISVQLEPRQLSDVISKSMADSDITEKIQDESIAIPGQDLTPITTLEESELFLQEPLTDAQDPNISYSEREMELSECRGPVTAGDISIQLEPSQPSDVISIPVEESMRIKWKKANNVLLERVKNLENACKTTHMSGVLYLASFQEVVTEEPIEQKNVHVQHNLKLLQSAVEKKDIVVIQKTIITTVETISTWLETVEYLVYLNRQKTNTSPTQEQIKEYGALKAEIINIEESVDALEGVLETTSGICNEDDKIHMKECLASLQAHVKAVEEIAQESEEKVVKDLVSWEEFLNGVNNISVMVEQLKQQLEEVVQSEISAQSKLQELEIIETVNCCHKVKTSCLLRTARKLVRDFPGREIPPETYTAHETTKVIEHSVALERERLLQLLSLADDYEQTLKEFSQIVDVADTLVDSPISVISLEHLQEEMQKHRKFFVNLSHCRGILESLEGNLDPETRASHSQLHQTLHCRATAILDKAASRAQQMALAASRWTVLEQGMKEERGWLQVAHQRVPDLQTVNSSDYDQYISLYQVSALSMVKQLQLHGEID